MEHPVYYNRNEILNNHEMKEQVKSCNCNLEIRLNKFLNNVSVISNDPPCKDADGYVPFTTVPLKPLSDQ